MVGKAGLRTNWTARLWPNGERDDHPKAYLVFGRSNGARARHCSRIAHLSEDSCERVQRSRPAFCPRRICGPNRAKIAVPEDAKNKQNRVPNSAEVLAEAKEHWADHCATCHANGGSGENAIGRQMYPIVRHKYIRL